MSVVVSESLWPYALIPSHTTITFLPVSHSSNKKYKLYFKKTSRQNTDPMRNVLIYLRQGGNPGRKIKVPSNFQWHIKRTHEKQTCWERRSPRGRPPRCLQVALQASRSLSVSDRFEGKWAWIIDRERTSAGARLGNEEECINFTRPISNRSNYTYCFL